MLVVAVPRRESVQRLARVLDDLEAVERVAEERVRAAPIVRVRVLVVLVAVLPSAPPPFSSPTSAFSFCATSIIFFLTFLTRFGFGETPNFFLTGERFVFSGCRTAFFFLSSFSLSGARLNWLSFSSPRTFFFLGMRFGGRARHFCVNVKMGSSSESLASKPELHASGSRWKLPAMI